MDKDAVRLKPGTRPKGGHRVTVRVSRQHLERYTAEAKDAGMPLSDYLASELAKAHKLDEPEWFHRDENPDQLKLLVPAVGQ